MSVFGEMPRLAAHRLLPAQAQPGEILEDGFRIFGAAARDVDILDAQQEAAAASHGARILRNRITNNGQQYYCPRRRKLRYVYQQRRTGNATDIPSRNTSPLLIRT